MVYLKYKNFSEAYYEISRLPIREPVLPELFGISDSKYLNNLVVELESDELDSNHRDLGNFNYTKVKWTTLLKKYIDNDDYFLLKKRLIESTCKTLTFNFKIHKNSAEKDKTWIKTRDSCLIALVFKRNRTKGFWTSVTVMWRSSEIFKKFPIDLILLNRMFNDLPNLNLEKIYLHIVQCTWASIMIVEMIETVFFPLDDFLDSSTDFAKTTLSRCNRYYGENFVWSNYSAIRRSQKRILEGIIAKPVPFEDLKMPKEEEN